MVNWSLNQEGSDSSSTNVSFGNAEDQSKSTRRRVSRSKTSAMRLDGHERVKKVVNGQVMSLRVRRVVRN